MDCNTADAKSTKMKFRKSPDAPKRFKSDFIFFSSEKHKEIRCQMEADGIPAAKTADVAKLVSEAWKNINVKEKGKWEDMARQDRARYEMEKAMYDGPWKVPAKKRSLKDPNAPKRPMSAYLAFSNSRRAEVKRQNPQMGNGELSRLLATMWREAPLETRQKYVAREYSKRQAYNAVTAKWKKKSQEEKRIKREERESVALRALEVQQLVDANKESTNDDGKEVLGCGSATPRPLGNLTEKCMSQDGGNALQFIHPPSLLSTVGYVLSVPPFYNWQWGPPYFMKSQAATNRFAGSSNIETH